MKNINLKKEVSLKRATKSIIAIGIICPIIIGFIMAMPTTDGAPLFTGLAISIVSSIFGWFIYTLINVLVEISTTLKQIESKDSSKEANTP